MIIHKDIQQGSQEWFELKLGKLSASRIEPLMAARGLGAGARTLAMEIVAETMTGEAKHYFINEAMQWGIDNEPEAREIYAANCTEEVTQVGGFEANGLFYSPDGVVGDDGLLEIKCPQAIGHIQNLLELDVDRKYIPQLQWGLMVSGRKWIDFISYNPTFLDDKAFRVVRVVRDEVYIELMQQRVEDIYIIINQINESLNGN